MALGDAQSGYDYNALLYNLDLSEHALYGGYFLIGLIGLAAVYTFWPTKRHKGRGQHE